MYPIRDRNICVVITIIINAVVKKKKFNHKMHVNQAAPAGPGAARFYAQLCHFWGVEKCKQQKNG